MPNSSKKILSRRKVLKLTGLGMFGLAGTAVLTACGDIASPGPGSVASVSGVSIPAGGATSAASAAGGPFTIPAKLRFGVGPLQATPEDSKKTYEPFFKYLADKLGTQFDLVATTDWAGISVALANDQVDLAWMGPWGYVLANTDSGAIPLATVKYNEKPVYHAIVVARPDLNINKWPEDGKGLKMSFADVGSTSGWLIPTTWFKSQGIDPKSYFQYSEGATHAANELAVASGQSDLATDFDRNRNAMIEGGKLGNNATKIVWTSDPLPNDAIAVRQGLDPALANKLKEIVLGITPEQAKTILPNHYTGFVGANHASYSSIEAAGIAVGRLKKK